MFALTPDPLAGAVLGHYRIRSRLGQGGMASVYLGERIDAEYQQRVAIKIANSVTASPEVLERFRLERQLLAVLDHPNIVRLIDGGTTPAGAPYLVMDCVMGRRITDYCRELNVPIRTRVDLIRKICGAIHYAHQRMVIHRDIKPSNILVTQDGEPKLLDFGIAKLMRGPGAEELTRPDARPMTLRYASPEQIRGETLTVASDVYALGTLLFELITGKSPFDSGDATDVTLSWKICNQEPPRLSGAASQTIDFDLEAIVAKALRKEPEHRYSSAGHLAEDLARYLDGLPVTAARGTILYRIGKFARREKAAAIATAAAALMLLGGVAAVMWQAGVANRERALAERRFQDVHDLSRDVLFDVHDTIERLPGALPARRLIVEKATQYLDRLNADAMGDRHLTLDLITGYQRVGFMQRSRTLENLGDTDGAIATFQKALKLSQSLLERFPGDAAVNNAVAESHRGLGDQYFVRGDGKTALSHYRSALPLIEGRAEYQRTEMKLCGVIGAMLLQQGKAAGAAPFLEKALAISEASYKKDPSSPHFQRDRAVSYTQLSHQRSSVGDLDSAVIYLNRAIEVTLESAKTRPGDARLKRDLFVYYSRMGGIWEKKKDPAKALAAYQQAMTLILGVAAADPDNIQAKSDLGSAYLHIGGVQVDTRRPAEACESYRRGIAVAQVSRAADAKAVEPAALLVDLYLGLGEALDASGRGAETPKWYAKALDLAESFAKQTPGNRRSFRMLADSHEAMGAYCRNKGRSAESESWYAKAREFREREKNPDRPSPAITARAR
jgi:non-specific serine/threonine protein kinase/serine/threonine-protein kinase